MHPTELKVRDKVHIEQSNFGHKSSGFDAEIVALYPSFAKVKDATGAIRSVSYGYIKNKLVIPSTSPVNT